MGVPRKDHTETRTETAPSGQIVKHIEHWDGSVDSTVQVLAVNIKAHAEILDVATDITIGAPVVGGKMTVEGGQQ